MTTGERIIWQNVFMNPNGEAVLMDILNRLGFFAMDRNAVNSDLIAVANWLLSRLGVLGVDNLTTYMHSIVSSASLLGTNDEGEPKHE